MEPRFFDRFLQEHAVPAEVDTEAIRREWLALHAPAPEGIGSALCIADRHLPLPVWARRPFTESGEEAWQTLCREVPLIDAAKPFCIYIHVPFCVERCHFCDCYSFRLASHRDRHISNYLDLLTQEMRLWSRLGTLAARPVSTVHLGGGTPTALGLKPFERLVSLCREHFAVEAATEWALESTVLELSPEMLSHLDGLGFTRLHVGVQTLQDEVRRLINRRATAEVTLATIRDAIEMGWIVSVDLIYGLPGQTLAGLLEDIRSLVAVGVDGFSLYELQISSSNRPFARRHGLDRRDRRIDYLMAQVIAGYLVSLGYKKTLFNHFAGVHDSNLYFTFPARGEDLLALGTIADGRFGDYHYRHPTYAAYCRSVNDSFPGLEGGLRRNEVENRLQPLVTALMAGSIPRSLFADPAAQRLLADWQRLLLVADDAKSGNLSLTGSGSWFVGNMLSQLMVQVAADEGKAADGG
jgi:coproporphyrinogen III oxidase-like Fe-S oxidoreductase